VAVDKAIVSRILGVLTPEDLERVTQGLRQAFGL
jgi:hypothetical protein